MMQKPPPLPSVSPSLSVPLNTVRLAALVQFVTLLLGIAQGLLSQNREGLRIAHRAGRKVSRYIHFVECARKARNWLGVHVPVSPGLPNGARKSLAPHLWMELAALHSDAREVSRLWIIGAPKSPP